MSGTTSYTYYVQVDYTVSFPVVTASSSVAALPPQLTGPLLTLGGVVLTPLSNDAHLLGLYQTDFSPVVAGLLPNEGTGPYELTELDASIGGYYLVGQNPPASLAGANLPPVDGPNITYHGQNSSALEPAYVWAEVTVPNPLPPPTVTPPPPPPPPPPPSITVDAALQQLSNVLQAITVLTAGVASDLNSTDLSKFAEALSKAFDGTLETLNFINTEVQLYSQVAAAGDNELAKYQAYETATVNLEANAVKIAILAVASAYVASNVLPATVAAAIATEFLATLGITIAVSPALITTVGAVALSNLYDSTIGDEVKASLATAYEAVNPPPSASATSDTPAVYLPTTLTPDAAQYFNVPIPAPVTSQPPTPIFIDPTIAANYTYIVGAGNPNFASVILPEIQTTAYQVIFANNGKQETDTVAPNTMFAFPTGGVSAFTVTGIDLTNPDLASDTPFVTGLTFVSGGNFTGTMTPLVDLGPTAGAVTASANLGQTIDLTAAIMAQVTPGLVGDTEMITAVGTASQGALKLTNGDLTYAAPANGSGTDTFTYTVKDQLGDQATGTVSVALNNPGVTTLGASGTPQSGTAPLSGEVNSLTVHAGPWVLTGPATIDDLTVDAGSVPSIVTVGSNVTVKKLTVSETYTGHPTTPGSVIPAGVTFSSPLAAGSTIDFSEPVTYTANFNGTNTDIVATATATQLIIANIEVLGNEQVSGSGTAELTVNPATVISGVVQGNANIKGGPQNNVVTAHGLNNTITESGGNDVVNAGAGSSVVRTGSGNVLVNLNGEDNTVVGGTGNVFVNIQSGGDNNIKLGTGSDTVVEAQNSEGSNTFVLTGTNATMTLYGANDVAFIHGGTDTITDDSNGLTVKIGPEGGNVALDNFLADPNGLVRLLGGVGGYLTGKAVVAALHSDGHGGAALSLGASGQIDFAGVALGSLHASQFHIG